MSDDELHVHELDQASMFAEVYFSSSYSVLEC